MNRGRACGLCFLTDLTSEEIGFDPSRGGNQMMRKLNHGSKLLDFLGKISNNYEMNESLSEKEKRESALKNFGGEVTEFVGEVETKEFTQMISVRMDSKLISKLRSIAQDRNVKISEIVRDAASIYADEFSRNTSIWTVKTSVQITQVVKPIITVIQYKPSGAYSGYGNDELHRHSLSG